MNNMDTSVINLPPSNIIITSFTINHTITFSGCPGTHFIIKSSPITLKSIIKSQIFVHFKECVFSLVSTPGDLPSTQILFQIEEGATLELQDCQLKAEGNFTDHIQKEKVFKPKYATCINLAKSIIDSDTNIFSAQANIISCSILYFSRAIVAEGDNSFKIEKSGIFKIAIAAISAVNPLEIGIDDSNIEACGSFGVEIKFNKIQFYKSKRRRIKIVNSNFNEMNGCGISLLGDKEPSKTFISLIGNQIQSCKENGIMGKDLAIEEVIMDNNNLKLIEGNGIKLMDCEGCKYSLRSNCSNENSGVGISLTSTSCNLSLCECNKNFLGGITILGNSNEKQESSIELEECNIKENKQSGVSIFDMQCGNVTLTKCRITDNKKYGLFLSSNKPQSSVKNTDKNGIILNLGEISFNKAGVYLQQEKLKIDGTAIKRNVGYAIFIPQKESSFLLELSPITITRKLVQGFIGGPWGENALSLKNKNCGCSVCSIV